MCFQTVMIRPSPIKLDFPCFNLFRLDFENFLLEMKKLGNLSEIFMSHQEVQIVDSDTFFEKKLEFS